MVGGGGVGGGGCSRWMYIYEADVYFREKTALREVTLRDKRRARKPNDEREWDHPGLINVDLKVR